MPEITVDLSGIASGDTLVWDGSKLVKGPAAAAPIVATTLAGLGTPNYNGARGQLQIGAWPNVVIEPLTWLLAQQKWIGSREYVLMRMTDTWAMDPSGYALADMRAPSWARMYSAIPYGKPYHAYITSDFVAGTDTTMNVSVTTGFDTGGIIRLREKTLTASGTGSGTLTGVALSAGGAGTVLANTPVTQGEVGGWGPTINPLQNAKALWDAGLRLQERVSGFMNGSQDSRSMSIRPFYFQASASDSVAIPPSTTQDGLTGNGIGGGQILTGPADDFVLNRATERPFATRINDWDDWIAGDPTEDLVWPSLYAQMPNDATDWGETYAVTVRVRWVSP